MSKHKIVWEGNEGLVLVPLEISDHAIDNARVAVGLNVGVSTSLVRHLYEAIIDQFVENMDD